MKAEREDDEVEHDFHWKISLTMNIICVPSWCCVPCFITISRVTSLAFGIGLVRGGCFESVRRETCLLCGYTCSFENRKIRICEVTVTGNSANTGRHLVELLAVITSTMWLPVPKS